MSADNHEFALIDRIRRQTQTTAAIPLGIGDDAALLATSSDRGVLITSDVLMDGVHFDASTTPPADIGRKALAVNLSDIAAMAGRPTAAIVGLVLPADRGPSFADTLMSGLLDLAAEYDVVVAGGDTNIWQGAAVISVTLLGEPTGGGIVPRSGAQPGDWLLVTGALGGSLGGRHLKFRPRVHEAQYLNATTQLHAMIDLSDGLASDIQHVLHASRVGALLEAAAIPIHEDVPATLLPAERLERALADGEDFELLLAVDPETGRKLVDQSPATIPLTHIGEITPEAGCWLRTADGRREPLTATGYEHRFTSP